MMRPHPFEIIAGANACDRKNGAAKLIASTASQSAGLTSSIGLRMLMPAALTTMSGAPKNDGARLAAADSASRSERSALRVAARPPVDSISRCTDASCSVRRPTKIIAAPASASAIAISRPIPEPAPVTRATGPPRSKRAGAVTTRCARRARSARRENTWRADRQRYARALPFLRAERCALWREQLCDWPHASCAATSPS